jgi:hypothetical protein
MAANATKNTGFLSSLRNALVGSMNQPATPFATLESDAMFDTARYLAVMTEQHLIKGQAALDKMIKANRGLKLGQDEFAGHMIQQGERETDLTFANGLLKFGHCLQTMSASLETQALEFDFYLAEFFELQQRQSRAIITNIAIKDEYRQDYSVAMADLERKRANLDKYKALAQTSADTSTAKDVQDQINTCLQDAKQEVEVAERYDAYLKDQTSRIAGSLRTEIPTFREQQAQDVRARFRLFAQRQLLYHEQMLRQLDAVQGDVQVMLTAGIQ